jgi:hypothetical protein
MTPNFPSASSELIAADMLAPEFTDGDPRHRGNITGTFLEWLGRHEGETACLAIKAERKNAYREGTATRDVMTALQTPL